MSRDFSVETKNSYLICTYVVTCLVDWICPWHCTSYKKVLGGYDDKEKQSLFISRSVKILVYLIF